MTHQSKLLIYNKYIIETGRFVLGNVPVEQRNDRYGTPRLRESLGGPMSDIFADMCESHKSQQ